MTATAGEEGARRAIVRLLGLMRDGKEIRQYLQRFSELDESRFAVIKVGGAVLRDELGVLAEALAFLHTVGLTPVVLHGGGPQLDAALAAAGVETRREDGLRVTTPDVLRHAREVFTAANLELVEAVRAAGARAAAIPMGVFDAEIAHEGRLGLVGSPTGARIDLIKSAAHAGAVPILTSLGATPDGQIVNLNADAAVRALVQALEPYKIIFLTDAGGVRGEDGALISAINLATDYEALTAAPWLNGGMRLKVEEIKSLLDVLPLTSSVSITRPDALGQELFTHGGAGTLVRRGEQVLTAHAKSDLDADRVLDLVADAFSRPASPEWWGELELARAYVTEQYRAGAFVTQLQGVGYLDKYAVRREARGEGLGQATWRAMRAEWPRLIWRARPDNPVNDFYLRECDGHVKRDGWYVFWIGLDGVEAAAPLVTIVENRPPTLEEIAA